MAANGFKIKNSTNLFPQAGSVVTTAGDIAYNGGTNNFEIYTTSVQVLITASSTTTLTNKTIDATTNTLLNITNTNLSGSAGITNANLAPMSTLTIKGNNTGGSATPSDLTVAQVNAILPVFTSSLNGLAPASGGGTTNFLRADGTWAAVGSGSPVSIAQGGTGASTAAGAFNNLNPMTTTGDMIYESATGVASRLPIGSNGQFLEVVSGIPTWSAVTIPTLTSLNIYAGKTAISNASTSVSPTFSTAFGSTSYAITATILNVTDTNPQFQPVVITAQSTTGFTATFNEPTDSANYVLSWIAIVNN